jgi:tetratricopeptide (TPR) repeat protein
MNEVLVTLFMQAAAATGTDAYVYPERVDLDTSCTLAAEKIKAIESQWSHPESGEAGVARAIPADLNRDGKCEIFLDNPADEEGNGYEFWTLLIERDGAYIPSGDIYCTPDTCGYGEFRNGYARIFVPENAGPKANPVFVTAVFAFDGLNYVAEARPRLTHGAYLDLGLEAYRSGNFALAEKYYLNAYRMNKDPQLSDASNLALAWLKLGRATEAKALLQKHLVAGGPAAQVAAAHFNLGLIEQRLGDLAAALRSYERANEVEPTLARREKIEATRKLQQTRGTSQ